jgi:hypothetical protein
MKEAAIEEPRPLRIPVSPQQHVMNTLDEIKGLLETLVEQGTKATNAPAASPRARK